MSPNAALVILLVACGCSSSSNKGPTLDDGDRAGSVTQVVGAVTAENPIQKAPRTLVMGGSVLAGDTIRTAPKASVELRLDHNGAIVAIAGDASVVLRKSPAWNAAAASAGALNRDENSETAVAGRHAERQAADTRATANALTRPPAPDKADKSSEKHMGSKGSPGRRAGGEKSERGETDGIADTPAKAAEEKPPAKTLPRVHVPMDHAKIALDSDSPEHSVAAKIRRRFRSAHKALAGCAKKHLPASTKAPVHAVVKLELAPSGSITRLTVEPSGPLGDCIIAELRKLRFPRSESGGTFELPLLLSNP